MLYLESGSTDPAFNLALEQYVFDTLALRDDFFMLWQNNDAVIVGLHQNTMEEVNHGFIKKNNITVVRRLSGGGAVYHDLGNLNYTFITGAPVTEALDFELSCRPIADALKSLGITVEFQGRNDMTLDGRKFSGNARYYRDGRLMHHGTMMFDVDMDKLSEALRVPDDKIVSKGIKSVRSRVVNLREYLDMTITEFWASIRSTIAGNMPDFTLSEQDLRAVDALRLKRYSTWEWNYGRSPEYSTEKRRRIDNFGTIRLRMSVERGRIAGFATDGDYFGVKPCVGVAAALRGVSLERDSLLNALSGFPLGEYYEGLSADALVSLILE